MQYRQRYYLYQSAAVFRTAAPRRLAFAGVTALHLNNWYAVNRIPYNLFNVNASIYEACFMSNPSEFEWYYNLGNWRIVAEAKIKVYVEALGKTYIPPTEN